jgi:hypothetical protein
MTAFAGQSPRSYLNLLRIWIEHSSARTSNDTAVQAAVVFEASRPDANPVRLQAAREEIGLSDQARELRRLDDSAFTLPARIGAGLAPVLPIAGGAPVWLELDPANPHLPLVPWERLFYPHLQAPLLRLVPRSLPHAPLEGPTDVLLCASVPCAKAWFDAPALLGLLIERIAATLPGELAFHVFTDAEQFAAVHDRLATWEKVAGRAAGSVTVYPPEAAVRFGEAPRAREVEEQPGRIDSPWLNWMLHALRGRTVDIVHFLCHSFFSLDQGALVFAESPLVNQDARTARFVGVAQLTTFLTHLGALSTVFTSPPQNYSTPGLRSLAHQVAGACLGPVLMQESVKDPEALVLGAAYRHLYGAPGAPPPSSPALCLYSHPARGAVPVLRDSFEAIGDRTAAISSGMEPSFAIKQALRWRPAWLAAGQRFLEQTAADLVETPPPDSERQHAAYEGTRAALDSIAEILQRHASTRENPR